MSAQARACEGDVSVQQKISDAMSRGLHQATQPLCVLQGTLELALLSAGTVDDFKSAVERSLAELQRVTDSFEDLRILARLQQPASDIATFSAASMVEEVLASLRGQAASAKIDFVVQANLDEPKASRQDRIRMSRSRVSAALKMALSDLLLDLRRGSRLLISIESDARSVLIRVKAADQGQIDQGHPEQPTETPSRFMMPRQELAREMTAIAGGELTLNPHPPGLQMRLPKVLLSTVCSEVEKQGEVSSCLV
jgi:signal transduction histidine kinase